MLLLAEWYLLKFSFFFLVSEALSKENYLPGTALSTNETYTFSQKKNCNVDVTGHTNVVLC